MKDRFRLIYRGERGATFYCVDGDTGKRTSLQTKDRDAARQIVFARNQAVRQPSINLQLAKAYLAGSDSGVATRTWQIALDAIVGTKLGPTQERWLRAAKDKALDGIRERVIIETTAEQLLQALKQGTVSTNVHLRKLHNYCLAMNWLPWPLIPKRLWPEIKFKDTDARLADLVYDYSWRSVERSTEYFTRIDTKATTLTGIVGVILTILLSSADAAFPEGRWSNGPALFAQAAYALSAIFLVVSLARGIEALSLRDTKDIPFIRDLIAEYKSFLRRPQDDIQIKKKISQRLSKVDYSYCFQVSRKIVAIRKSTRFLALGLLCLAVSIILALLSITLNSYARTE
jgi:hypothetical protein